MNEPLPDRFLLDTNILLHLMWGSPLAQAADSRFGLRTSLTRPLISVVTVGECRAFGRKRNWGLKKLERLDEMLRQFVIVDINTEPVLNSYAEIDAYCQQHGKKPGKNDLWIAATSTVTRARLLTSDKDFQPLEGVFLRHEYFDPEAYR